MDELSAFTATCGQSISNLGEPTQEGRLNDLMSAYKHDIILARQEGFKIDRILAWLNEEGVKIGRSKLYQYLKDWDAQVQRPALTDEQIHGSVLPLAQRTLLSDGKIASKLAEDLGIDASRHQVKRARIRYRAIKHFRNPIEREV